MLLLTNGNNGASCCRLCWLVRGAFGGRRISHGRSSFGLTFVGVSRSRPENFSNTLARCDLGGGSELGRPVRAPPRVWTSFCVLRSSYSSARQLLSAFLLLRFFFFVCSFLQTVTVLFCLNLEFLLFHLCQRQKERFVFRVPGGVVLHFSPPNFVWN